MILNKYDRETHEYKHYEVPDDWNIKLFTDDMDMIVNCVQCGKELRYGNCYTSLEVHNHIGFGYPVCERCYQKEWKRRKKNERNDDLLTR